MKRHCLCPSGRADFRRREPGESHLHFTQQSVLSSAQKAIIPAPQQSAVICAVSAITLHLPSADPKSGSSGSADRHRPFTGPNPQHVVSDAAVYDPICCISHPDRDLLPSGRYCRFAYSLTVVHFRKVVIRQKTGSAGDGHPVIYLCGYVAAYYQAVNDRVRGKSSGVTVSASVRDGFEAGLFHKDQNGYPGTL
ncbi:hypothetical protein FJP64_22095 [Kosakonia cowanii]|nr:hypothetical protein [Atlantibacter hermannii]TPD59966.1 hypothetical protein FJP70_22070 [Kosakonia cowanii]TPD83410.1 hypothetical protein FJP67_22065 [Kosakonia cowanii]TPE00791.1 hypothetical protein FJP64_22095 [Kosakonia cowanii]